jgi:type I restriction enzyme R subunit
MSHGTESEFEETTIERLKALGWEHKATVPIYYAPRQIKLHLSRADIDAALARIVADANVADADRRKSRWAALAKAAGAQERIDELSKDLLAHFLDRSQTLRGKAMIVFMTRENCVRLYDALRAIPGCPEIKVIMTGDLSEDPQEWNDAGHITTKPQRKAIKKRMIAPDDQEPLVRCCRIRF